ncbi:MAG: outer membrane beta-barrel protein [Planctomycetota bacterium]
MKTLPGLALVALSLPFFASCSSTSSASSITADSRHHDRDDSWGERRERYSERVHNVHILVGEMQLEDEGYWDPLDDPLVFGIDYANYSTDNGLGPELGFYTFGDSTGSSSTDEDFGGMEIFAGMRQTFGVGGNGAHPYVGVGGTLIAATLEGPGYSDTDGSLGLYAHGGITFPLAPGIEFGVDYRIVRGTESEFEGGPDSEFDYERIALLLGWSF